CFRRCEAMEEASQSFVLIEELGEAIGRKVAELTGAEWGIVTAGSAAGFALAAAACVAGNDPERMLRLPLMSENAPVVMTPRGQRFAYDQAYRIAGCIINEFDTLEMLESAFATHSVAFVSVLANRDALSPTSLAQLSALCRKVSVPIVVDAAS